jgi:hypothetical protein
LRGINGLTYVPSLLQGVSIVGTVETVDDILGVASIDGQAVFLGSIALPIDLAVGAIVSVSGVTSVDGTLILADDVTVIAGGEDEVHGTSNRY